MIYVGQGVKISSKVNLIQQSVVQWLNEEHLKNQRQPIQVANLPSIHEDETPEFNALLDQIKKEDVPYFLASAFGSLNDPLTPVTAERSVRKNGGILRDFIVLDYDLTSMQDAFLLFERFTELFGVNYRSAIYPTLRFPWQPRFRAVIEVDQLLDRHSYEQAAEFILELIGIDSNDFVANTTIAHTQNGPYYLHERCQNYARFNLEGPKLSLVDLGFEVKNAPKARDEDEERFNVYYREDQIEPAILAFVEDPHIQEQLQSYDYFWRFAESLADARRRNLINDEFVTQALTVVALGNKEWEMNNFNIYQTQYEKLINQPDKRDLVKPLASYLPIVEQIQTNNQQIKNLAKLLESMLPQDFEGDASSPINEACDVVSEYFEFALIPGVDRNSDGVAIFNPLRGIWMHDENELIALLSLVKPGLSESQLRSAMMYWGAKAHKEDRYLKPYNQSRYLVFKNCVLDITTDEEHSLASPLVKELQFTNRHAIDIDYDPNPELITFEKDGMNEVDWTIEKFIQAYAHNNDTLRTYFLFGMALGLFAGHNTGVHFDIQGESGSGKSTLATIYRGLFGPNRVAEITFSKLNEDFPLTSYDLATAIIWIKEANYGVAPLSEDSGIPFYDSLADGSARISVKHGGDLIVHDPPQVFIDGTSLITAQDVQTGPARRTLAYKLPPNIEELRPQFYSNNITERLLDERVLQYLVVEMLKAYKVIVPPARQGNFKMNLGVKADLELLPPQALAWRQEFVSADENVREWWDTEIKDLLKIDNTDVSFTDNVFHLLYLQWYRSRNPQDPHLRFARSYRSFKKILTQIFDEDGLYKIWWKDNASRRRRYINDVDKWGIDWTQYDQLANRPYEFEPGDPKSYHKKRIHNVYILSSQKPDAKFFEKQYGEDGGYEPVRPIEELPKPSHMIQ